MFNNKKTNKMKTITIQSADSQQVSEKGREDYTVTINGKNIENFDKFEASLYYLTKMINGGNGRSIASQSKTMSKHFSKEFLQKMIVHPVCIASEKFRAVQAILNHYKKEDEKEAIENHVENMKPILSEILTICRNKVIERFAPTRKALEDAVQAITEIMNKENLPVRGLSKFTGNVVLTNEVNDKIKAFVEKKFDVDLNERFSTYDRRKEAQDQANQFDYNVYRCFRYGTENEISEMENQKVETETFKLLTNLAKYCPLGTDEVKINKIDKGAKGFEINADLYSKGEFLNEIYTNAHSAGGYNIQSFHFRYKTTVKK